MWDSQQVLLKTGRATIISGKPVTVGLGKTTEENVGGGAD